MASSEPQDDQPTALLSGLQGPVTPMTSTDSVSASSSRYRALTQDQDAEKTLPSFNVEET